MPTQPFLAVLERHAQALPPLGYAKREQPLRRKRPVAMVQATVGVASRVWSARDLRLVATSALLVGLAAPAQGLQMTESGSVATLSGLFEHRDEGRFRAFLDRPRPVPLRVLYLNSPGGNLQAGLDIGRQVRRAGLTTAIQADRHICDSACTLAFAGGVRRHNINGSRIFEGMSSMMGLGFHPAWRQGNRVDPSLRSDEATGRVRAFYAEMGMPRAAVLVDRAAINSMFRPSGRTSLELNIATSLSPP
jgi:hypothetical protein